MQRCSPLGDRTLHPQDQARGRQSRLPLEQQLTLWAAPASTASIACAPNTQAQPCLRSVTRLTTLV